MQMQPVINSIATPLSHTLVREKEHSLGPLVHVAMYDSLAKARL